MKTMNTGVVVERTPPLRFMFCEALKYCFHCFCSLGCVPIFFFFFFGGMTLFKKYLGMKNVADIK